MPASSHPPVYLVTGASGFVGRALCRRLIGGGARVHAVVRRCDRELEKTGVKLWLGDLWDEDVLPQALQGVEYVIHCAGDAVFGNGPQYLRSNVALTEHVVGWARKQPGLRRFVYVSTIGAIDRTRRDDCRQPLDETSAASPTSDYGRSKLEAEARVAAAGLSYAIIRPAMVVGEEMRRGSHFAVFARQAIRGGLFARLAWPGCFSVVHVDDLAEALRLVAVEPAAEGRIFFCAGEQISLAKFFELCRPGSRLVPLGWLEGIARQSAGMLPFSVKALLLPALTASDAQLRALGWIPSRSATAALSPVVARERARDNPDLSPGGQTVVTGAASGLGRALVERLAGRRERVLLVDRDAAALAEVASAQPNCQALVADLSTESGVQAVIRSAKWQQHPVTELYSCAGIGRRGRMQDVPAEDHRRMFQVNVLARVEMAQCAIAEMIPRQFGRVVLISSSSAFQPLPCMATYAATNSALLSIGEAWSVEVSGQGVDVMTVCPGGMQTNFQQSAGVRQIEGERLMSPADVADAILGGLRSHRMTLVVSARSHAMSWLARMLPRKITAQLWGRLMEKMR